MAPSRSTVLGVAGFVATLALFFGSTNSEGRQNLHPDHIQHMSVVSPPVPTMPGQDAFGAIQEIVGLLEANPNTDWSKNDLAALREHLVDMNEVTLRAEATTRQIDNGLQVDITGSSRTLAAIRRMMPAHAHELDTLSNWHATSEDLFDGVRLTVTAGTPEEVIHLRGLRFAGLLVSGSQHQQHHLAIAKGEMVH